MLLQLMLKYILFKTVFTGIFRAVSIDRCVTGRVKGRVYRCVTAQRRTTAIAD